jgi:Dolichyl-phosphate-mannose-protein mannosyltransferase
MLKETKARTPYIVTLLAILVGIFAKLSLTTGELLPGRDGPYYWVQVRSLLNDSTLAFSDLPLVFWVQAFFAKILGNVQMAVRFSDAMLPAISAIPIFLISRKYEKPWLSVVAIPFVLLHPIQLYFFTGDFLKNEAAIPLVFFLAWVLLTIKDHSKVFTTLGLAAIFLMIALSHFGTLLLAVLIFVLWVFAQCRSIELKLIFKSLGLILLISGLALISLALLAPSRYQRLIAVMTSPEIAFASPRWESIINGRSNSIMVVTIVLGQVWSVFLALMVRINRRRFQFSEVSLLLSTLISSFILSSPLFGMEWSDRFVALSFVPLSIASLIILGRTNNLKYKLPIWILVGVTLLSSVYFSQSKKTAIFTQKQYQDLKALSAEIKFPDDSVIAAFHGLEFLAAWEFNSKVVVEDYYERADLSSYKSIYRIRFVYPDEKLGTTDSSTSKEGKPKDKPVVGKEPITIIDKSDKRDVIPARPGLANPPISSGEVVAQNQSFIIFKLR